MADTHAKGRETASSEAGQSTQTNPRNEGNGGQRRSAPESQDASQDRRDATRAAQDVMQGGTEAARRGFENMASNVAEQSRRTTGSVREAMEVHRETVRSASEDIRAATTAATLSAEGLIDIDAAVLDVVGQATEATARVSQRLVASRSPREAADAQREFTETMMKNWIDGSMLILRATQDIAGRALGPITERVEQRVRS